MLPDRPLAKTSAVVAKVFRVLKKINCEELVCRLAFQLDTQERPHFYAVYRKQFAYLIAVSDATTDDLINSLQGDLFTDAANKRLQSEYGLPELDTLMRFMMTASSLLGHDGNGHLSIEKWVVFPHADQAVVNRFNQVIAAQDCRLIGKEHVDSDTLLGFIEQASHQPLDDTIIKVLQKLFSPEVSIPANWATRSEQFSNQASQTMFFLDLDQESAVKKDLELSLEAHQATVETNLRLLTGVAGSGKSLVLVHRAQLLASMQPDAHILLLTHNRPLSSDLGSRLEQLGVGPAVECKTFFQWATAHLEPRPQVISASRRRDLLHKIASQTGIASRYAVPFLEDEFDWMTDNDLVSESAYLEVERIGRQKGLREAQRKELFELFRQYRRQLNDWDMTDWPGVALRFLYFLQSTPGTLAYDAILIDEAQFFSPVQFRCIQLVTRPQLTQITMAADPTQGFLRSRQSWQKVGFEVRGRTQKLQVPYRSTRAILDFATAFYRRRLPQDDDEINLPEEAELEKLPIGSPPKLEQCRSHQDMIAKAVNEALKAVDEGIDPRRILLVHGERIYSEEVIARICQERGALAVDARHANRNAQIRVCSLNAVTGLEAPIVILFGIDDLFESERALDLEESERQDRIRVVTRKVFVGMTRCSDRLLILFASASTLQNLI